VLPSVLAVATAGFAGLTADRLLADGMDLTVVRKNMQTAGFVLPALCLGLLGLLGSGAGAGGEASLPAAVPIALLTVGIAGGSFSLAGLYASHADLSAKYSGLVNGVSTTFGALAGVCSNSYAGYVLANTGSWSQAIFLPSVVFYGIGCVAYAALYDAKPIDFDSNADPAVEAEAEGR